MIHSGLFLCWCFSLLRCLGFISVIRLLRSQLRLSGTVIVAVSLSLFFVFACRGVDVSPVALRWNFPHRSVEQSFELLVVGAFEFSLGALIGLPISLFLEALLQGARLGDVVRGAHYAEQISASGKRVSVFENLTQVYILAVGVPFAYPGAILAMKHSLTLVPLGSFPSFSFPNFSGPRSIDMLSLFSAESRFFMELGNKAFLLTCLAVSSILMVNVLLDVFLALLSRVMGRANVFSELMPLKLILGLVLASVLLVEPPTIVKESLNSALTYKILGR